jgi:histone acetyltransferase (RNA polymerase elongator complex component)
VANQAKIHRIPTKKDRPEKRNNGERMKLIVRKFRKDDAREVSSLVIGNLYDSVIVEYTKRQLDLVAERYSIQKIIQQAEEYELFVALADNKIVGIIGLQDTRIRSLFVDIDYQNRGIGKTLVKMAEKMAVEKRARKITVHSSLNTVLFYKRLGYTPKGKMNDEEIQVMKMEKKLQEEW